MVNAIEPLPEEGDRSSGPAAILRGTSRGLEIIVDGSASTLEIIADVMKRLDEAPAFFRGSPVHVRVDNGPLATGCLARLDEIAEMFELRIVEVTANRRAKTEEDAVPVPENLAAGSAPSASFDEEPTQAGAKLVPLPPVLPELREPVTLPADTELTELDALVVELGESFDEPTQTAVPIALAPSPESELETHTSGTRIVIGPVRSGVVLEHHGHLVVFGDINPGAEVRAAGNIVVLGRLRGTAHAGIGQDVGFILALRLEPQQLRIGRQVARAADSDTPGNEPEIAYGSTGERIVVESYQGKLPRNLATSI
jgi:septum formation inhibitor MinC